MMWLRFSGQSETLGKFFFERPRKSDIKVVV